jgi:hypothetical protein
MPEQRAECFMNFMASLLPVSLIAHEKIGSSFATTVKK